MTDPSDIDRILASENADIEAPSVLTRRIRGEIDARAARPRVVATAALEYGVAPALVLMVGALIWWMRPAQQQQPIAPDTSSTRIRVASASYVMQPIETRSPNVTFVRLHRNLSIGAPEEPATPEGTSP